MRAIFISTNAIIKYDMENRCKTPIILNSLNFKSDEFEVTRPKKNSSIALLTILIMTIDNLKLFCLTMLLNDRGIDTPIRNMNIGNTTHTSQNINTFYSVGSATLSPSINIKKTVCLIQQSMVGTYLASHCLQSSNSN
ncbi:hypothetical protein BpHYR1_017066 [Brachionus plicatilis]|uniref:Uncharacterized protein n=1 Tax=Brachionus plicatilis TaxID=10195 RepID=A0A3M7RQV1_BRAPC|nr:hypothetical protein BpHYR1_017066 [Brachionus plicatilis]